MKARMGHNEIFPKNYGLLSIDGELVGLLQQFSLRIKEEFAELLNSGGTYLEPSKTVEGDCRVAFPFASSLMLKWNVGNPIPYMEADLWLPPDMVVTVHRMRLVANDMYIAEAFTIHRAPNRIVIPGIARPA